jgi:hypothetical protein
LTIACADQDFQDVTNVEGGRGFLDVELLGDALVDVAIWAAASETRARLEVGVSVVDTQ